ncbi:hypothetical protein MRB53_010306 [Persea americana]|uniref:Uncharacterized protein n=1 Tax=Persea americana TaxID=3435 RepID=A0ACC2LRG3_PERAE|nr:hypothetical protein MRB53_010306 [Persea americana]
MVEKILGFGSVGGTGEDVKEGGMKPKGRTLSESEMEGRWKRMRTEREVWVGVGRYGRWREKRRNAEEEGVARGLVGEEEAELGEEGGEESGKAESGWFGRRGRGGRRYVIEYAIRLIELLQTHKLFFLCCRFAYPVLLTSMGLLMMHQIDARLKWVGL